MQTQTILVVLILAAAAFYLVRRWFRTLARKQPSCCSGCSGCGAANAGKDKTCGPDSGPPPGCPGCG